MQIAERQVVVADARVADTLLAVEIERGPVAEPSAVPLRGHAQQRGARELVLAIKTGQEVLVIVLGYDFGVLVVPEFCLQVHAERQFLTGLAR